MNKIGLTQTQRKVEQASSKDGDLIHLDCQTSLHMHTGACMCRVSCHLHMGVNKSKYLWNLSKTFFIGFASYAWGY